MELFVKASHYLNILQQNLKLHAKFTSFILLECDSQFSSRVDLLTNRAKILTQFVKKNSNDLIGVTNYERIKRQTRPALLTLLRFATP